MGSEFEMLIDNGKKIYNNVALESWYSINEINVILHPMNLAKGK